jgi:limonene 1,2-monooxygenase
MSEHGLRTGIFLAPFHPVEEDPTRAIQRDLALIERLDALGYDEAWVGEHHSAGFEIIASPELFIAAAAERTRRIRLGTGVISLPYHNPLMVANRMIQLDHMTLGRAMFGVGPGLLPSDAMMLGIEPVRQRDMMIESLEVILQLLAGETVTYECDWFKLREARCQLRPYTRPRPEMAVASTITPSGGRAAGKYGMGMLCVAATQNAGYDVLGTNWRIAEELAAERGASMSRRDLRCVGPMHLARTREEARAHVRFGLEKWQAYFYALNPVAGGRPQQGGDPVDGLVSSGMAVIGTPDDAIEQIERLQKQTGGFGTYLFMAHNWAPFEQTLQSYELFANYVKPHFNGSNVLRVASLESTNARAGELMSKAGQGIRAMFEKHMTEQAAKKRG